MKHVYLFFLLFSCAHSPTTEQAYILDVKYNYNKENIDSFEMIVKNDNLTHFENDSINANKTSSLNALIKKGSMKGVDGFFVSLDYKNKSKKNKIIKTMSEIFVKDGERATFSEETSKGIFEAQILVATLVQKGVDPRICMATIYEAQEKFKNVNKMYADKIELLSQDISCPKQAKISLTKLNEDKYIVIGSFNDVIWVITEDKTMIQAQK